MNEGLLSLALLIFAVGHLALPQENANAVYKDPKAPIPDRVHDLLGRMTPDFWSCSHSVALHFTFERGSWRSLVSKSRIVREFKNGERPVRHL